MTDRAMLTPGGNRAIEGSAAVVQGTHVVNGPPGSALVRGASTHKVLEEYCPVPTKSGGICKGKPHESLGGRCMSHGRQSEPSANT